MAILKVAHLGHPVLRTKAQPVPPAEIGALRFQQLIDDMFETMHEYQGIGLAAPQVHVSSRIFVAGLRTPAQVPGARGALVMDDDHDMPLIAVINPELSLVPGERIEAWEGCLSIPDLRGKVPRAAQIKLRALDRHGKRIEIAATGLSARVIQHENDHLDGILFFDRMPTLATLTYMDEYQRFWAKSDDDHHDKTDA